jgi:hypothetical protein
MFIRIVRDKHESTYECQRYHVAPQEDGTTFLLTIEGDIAGTDGQSMMIDVDTSEHLAVYLMNNEGKTIDTIFRDMKSLNS